MILTEDEAKEKWCPQAGRAVITANSQGHWELIAMGGAGPVATIELEATTRRPQQARDLIEVVQKSNRCLGSACMAWRAFGHRQADGRWRHPLMQATQGLDTKAEPGDIATGYCGLAGGGSSQDT